MTFCILITHLNQYCEIIFFSPILANNNLPLKIYCKSIVIIYIDFNLNILLQFFFSLSKQIIFFSPILTNNNLSLKIYCENIITVFLNFNFLFFILCFPYFIFYPYFLLFFPLFFSPPHTYPSLSLSLFFLPLPPEHSTFLFLFLLSPFSLPLPQECSSCRRALSLSFFWQFESYKEERRWWWWRRRWRWLKHKEIPHLSP